ncbi:MAG TPA: glycosyltransferase family 4 protein [Caulobacterales bacterium]|nr:glycosyltransferase family 4 protein [Caulobacterales bacterium]
MTPATRRIIYWPDPLARNAGGPSGYLWHLREGLREIGAADAFAFVTPEAQPRQRKNAKAWKSAALAHPLARPLFLASRRLAPSKAERAAKRLLETPLDAHRLPAGVEAMLADGDVALHCHSTMDALRAHNSLAALGRRQNVRLWLTSHTPEMPAREKADKLRATGAPPSLVERATVRWLEIDRAAFASVDELVFPCPEALEPYVQTDDQVGAIFAKRPMRYVYTGIVDPPHGAHFALPGEGLRFAYAGRHNSVKGYDWLAEAAPPVLDATGAWMIVAGGPGPVAAPTHPRWRELGWIANAPDMIRAADVFILPNRRTYFDLIALEVMAAGAPLLASATGGNVALARESEGVVLFEPSREGLGRGMREIAARGRENLKRLGETNRAAYEAKFSAARFARAYATLWA